jgi:hypothetical protein
MEEGTPLSKLLLFFEQRLREGGNNKKTGDMLAYLFTDCALVSACHFVFSVCVEMQQ